MMTTAAELPGKRVDVDAARASEGDFHLAIAEVAKQREGIASAVDQLQNKFPNILTYESRDSADLVLNASLMGLKFGDADLRAFAPVANRVTVADFSRTAITDRAAPGIVAPWI